jgi:hypothetical protein
MLFIALVLMAFTQVDDQSIWHRCDTSNVDAVVFMDRYTSSSLLYDTPEVWLSGDVNRDLPTITGILNLQGRVLEWNNVNGFDDSITEQLRSVGWEILVADEIPVVWSQWWQGRTTGDFYVLITNDMRHYVADYGGSDSWHVKCGGWIVEKEQ